MDIAKVTYAPFTMADRMAQDAALAMYHAREAAAWRRKATPDAINRRLCLTFARRCERAVFDCASRIEVRLQLLADQAASAGAPFVPPHPTPYR